MNKKITLVIFMVLSFALVGSGIYLSIHLKEEKEKTSEINKNEETKKKALEEALEVITSRTMKPKENYKFEKIDEDGNYVFLIVDNSDVRIIVNLEEKYYKMKTTIKREEKLQ